jgi:hypothetical protein
MRRNVLLVALFTSLVSGGAVVSAAAGSVTKPSQARWLNPPTPGALVEYSIRADGTGRTQISDFGPQVAGLLQETLSRSPDGTAFATANDGLSVGYPGMGYPSRTMGLAPLVPPGLLVINPDFDGATATFSPDGNWVAFTVGKCIPPEGCSTDCQKDCVDSHVYVVKTDGTGLHEVAPNGTSPSWSADGKWIVYQGFVGDAAFGGYTGVYVVRRDGKLRTRLAVDGSDPVFAPRGNFLAYHCGGTTPAPGSGAGLQRRPSVCVMNRNGSGKRVIGTGYSRYPDLRLVWSPDATKIAIVLPELNGVAPTYYGHLVVLFANGVKPLTVLRAARITEPLAWSPDSRQIAYMAQTLSQDIYTDNAVYVASTITHRSTFITDDPVSPNDVEWTNRTQLTYLTFLHPTPYP